jgi:hypothetical protein
MIREQTLQALENKMLRKIFESNRDEVCGQFRILNEEISNLYK